MSAQNNMTYMTPANVVERKRQKSRRIITLSVLGLSTLAVAVSLPFGFLTNFVNPPVVADLPVDYDKEIPLSKSNVDFDAYYVPKWQKLTLTEILTQINLDRDSPDLTKQITLQNLSSFGIVPKSDKWKSWSWVKSAPIEGSAVSFRMMILETVGSTTPFSYDVIIPNNSAITASPFYNANYRMATSVNFYAYRPTTLTTLSDFYLTYLKSSTDPQTSITIENLEKIGIVPILDEYKLWDSITLFPTDGRTIRVSIQTRPGSNSPIDTYTITGFSTSTFYNADATPITSNPDFVAYIPNSFINTPLINLSLEFARNSFDPTKQINFANLEKIGIVPLNNNYKLWETITIYPISGTQVKCIVQTSSSGTQNEYNISGIRPSPSYDVSAPTIQNANDFIMYVPNAWKNMFPVEATFTYTSTAALPENRITLETLDKMGIVPKNLEYKTWTSITVTPISSATCNVVIKKQLDNIIVANFNANCFKTSGTYDAATILKTSTTRPFNFIWYKPIAWNNIPPKDININFTAANISLQSLENIGIVPLNDGYKSWSSILKSDILYGLQGKFNVTMSSTTQTPLSFEISNLKKSTIYDSSQVIFQYPSSTNPDFIQFQPNAFKRPIASYLETLKLIRWTGRQISIEKLETIGIVPINNDYEGWTIVEWGYQSPDSNTVTFRIYNKPNGAYTEVTYPFMLVIG